MYSDDGNPPGPSNPENKDLVQLGAVHSVSERLPGFWKQDPEMWFVQANAIFASARITTSKRKFEDTVAKLDYEILRQVADIVKNPTETPYEDLQRRLVATYSETENERIKRLLEDKQLGDQKPSQFLREKRLLAGDRVNGELLKTLWLRGLPRRMHDILMAVDQTDLDKLAGVADRLHETYEPSAIHAVSQVSQGQDNLYDLVRQLAAEVAALRLQHRSRSSSRASPRTNSSNSASRRKLCFFHRRFGRRAKKCEQPCDWEERSSTQSDKKKFNDAAAEADAVADTANRRLFVSERTTGQQFLIDTGAAVSVYPVLKATPSKKQPTDYSLYAANGSKISTYGEIRLHLDLGMRRPYTWTFILADVTKPIIGADLLYHWGLSVDLRGRCLTDRATGLSTHGRISTEPIMSIQVIPDSHWCADLLKLFPDVTRPSAGLKEPKHAVQHFIETKGPPVTARSRRLPPDKFIKVREMFHQMVADGIIRPSKSPWASPLHVVYKKNGELRPCGDYRALNDKTVPDRYGVPNLLDFQNNLYGRHVFTSLDLNCAYFQVPIHEADIPKTAIITPFGLFEFTRMCFGLRNASQTFQRFMDSLFRDLPYVYVYIDDILISSVDLEEHRLHLREVLSRLNEAGVTLNLEKCVFAQSEVDFLGYHVTPQGITPHTDRVNAIVNFPQPSTVRQLRRFLGMFNFYHRCIPKASHVQQRLTDLLKGRSKNSTAPLNWTDLAIQAFTNCKEALAAATVLDHPSVDAQISLACDASDTHVGAVLQQRSGDHWKPLGFFSKSLTSTQQRYSTYDRELLAVYLAVKHFRPLIEGRQFIIFTDHRPLIHAFFQKVDSATPRRIRQLTFISEFTTDIRHVAGEDNPVADALSRIEALDLPDDLPTLVEEQGKDESITELLKSDHLKLEKLSLPFLDKPLWCEHSMAKPRPYLPPSTRFGIYQKLHRLSHPGVRATRKLIADRYFWPGMNSDIAVWTRACTSCQRAKIQRHTVSTPGIFAPVGRFEHVHLDLVGPLPPSEGMRYCLTAIDRASRWPEAYPLADITAETVATTFFANWIPRFGVPVRLTTDQGRQFESSLFNNLAKLLGSQRCRTTAYHPQANGCIERWHRCLKAALMAQLDGASWTKVLPTVLLGLRATVRDDTNASCAEAVYGQPLCLPGEFLCPTNNPPITEATVHQFSEAMTQVRPANFRSSAKTCFRHKNLDTSSHVFVRRDNVAPPLTPPYHGPYKVLERSTKTFKIQMPDRQVVVSVDRLKPAFFLDDAAAGFPPAQSANDDSSSEPTPLLPTPSPEPRRTRSGRLVRPSVRFCDVVIGGCNVAVRSNRSAVS